MFLEVKVEHDKTLSSSLWERYKHNNQNPALKNEEMLLLTPSSIDTYLKCPRRFFYRNILKLREDKTTLKTLLGNCIHRILEVFNRNFQQKYTFQNLLQLFDEFFNLESNLSDDDSHGFSASDHMNLKSLSSLERYHLEKMIKSAFCNLETGGYFDIPFKSLCVEERLELDSSFGLTGINLYGRVDLIRQTSDNHIEIVDYKTSRQKYSSSRSETNLKSIFKALEPIDWNENETTRYEGRDYQLPLYWLMALSDSRFCNYTADITIQLVQPGDWPGKRNITLTVTYDQLKQGMNNLLEVLDRGIIEPIRTTSRFKPLGNPQKDCKTCSYVSICSGSEQEQDVCAE